MRQLLEIMDRLEAEHQNDMPQEMIAALRQRLADVSPDLHVWKAAVELAGMPESTDGADVTPNRIEIMKKVAAVLLETDDLYWLQRMEWCSTPEDYRRLFRLIGIPNELWRNSAWLNARSKLPPEQGGIGRTLQQLSKAIRTKFKTHPQFVAWMDGKEAPDGPWRERVAACLTPEDFLTLFTDLGVPGDNWKNSAWLQEKAPLPPEEGGLGKRLQMLTRAIREDERFGSYQQFVAWMEGKEKPEPSMKEKIASLLTPDDFLRYFAELGIPGDKWRTVQWMERTSSLPPEKGGIGKPLVSVSCWIRADPRFKAYRVFNAWMDGKAREPEPYTRRVKACTTREEFLRLFADLEIPGEKWREAEWLYMKAKLPAAEGGIDRNLSGLVVAIRYDDRFKSYPHFIAWMDGRDEVILTWPEEVAECRTPDDFRALFGRLGVDEEVWRKTIWNVDTNLGVTRKGQAKLVSGLPQAIGADSRWKSYRRFVAWMDGKDEPDPSLATQVQACVTPEDFLRLFESLGIPTDAWRSSAWLTRTARLPHEEGGIALNLATLYNYIKGDERFESYPHFVAWMDGLDQPTLTFWDKVDNCKTPDDFLALFAEIGMPDGVWHQSRWWAETSKLPVEEGGVNKGYAGFPGNVARDERFGSFSKWVAWMQGKDRPDPDMVERVSSCKTREDFLAFFAELGIPNERWRSSSWLQVQADLPPEQGGVGRSFKGLYRAIRLDERFGAHPQFVAWMDGKEEPDAKWPQIVAACQTPDEFRSLFAGLDIPGECWRNSNWLQQLSKLPIEEGGISKGMAALAQAIRHDKRFSGHRLFVAWMDGWPFEGITSPEQASTLLQIEAFRLGVDAAFLLDPKQIGAYLDKSPLLEKIIAYFEQSHE